jgi:DNA mismatch endonuclease (patch repair protein)
MAIFVHGCFWHRHAGCFYTTTPKTRQAFWEEKFLGNISRDKKACVALQQKGWRVLVVWECGLKHCLEGLPAVPRMIDSGGSYLEWPVTPPRIRSA